MFWRYRKWLYLFISPSLEKKLFQWNNHGYDVAKFLGGKFTHVSPVWLQMKRHAGRNIITGDHDIDQGWIKDVRKAGKSSNVKGDEKSVLSQVLLQ